MSLFLLIQPITGGQLTITAKQNSDYSSFIVTIFPPPNTDLCIEQYNVTIYDSGGSNLSAVVPRKYLINDTIDLKTIMDVNTSFQLCNFNFKFQVSASRGFEPSALVLGLVNFEGKNFVFVLGNICNMNV